MDRLSTNLFRLRAASSAVLRAFLRALLPAARPPRSREEVDSRTGITYLVATGPIGHLRLDTRPRTLDGRPLRSRL